MTLKKNLINWNFLFFLPLCFIILSCHTNQTVYQELSAGFRNPPNEARPKVYWWILNGNLDTATAKKELRDLKEAGITGFDFFEIGVPKGDSMIPGGPAFLSDESLAKSNGQQIRRRRWGWKWASTYPVAGTPAGHG